MRGFSACANGDSCTHSWAAAMLGRCRSPEMIQVKPQDATKQPQEEWWAIVAKVPVDFRDCSKVAMPWIQRSNPVETVVAKKLHYHVRSISVPEVETDLTIAGKVARDVYVLDAFQRREESAKGATTCKERVLHFDRERPLMLVANGIGPHYGRDPQTGGTCLALA